MITHSAFDWLFRHALLSIKTSISFLKGSNRGIANNKYAVRRAQLKLVKVTRGSSFEQTMMGRSPQCYIPSFEEIGLSVPEKNFEGFLLYMGVAAIFVM